MSIKTVTFVEPLESEGFLSGFLKENSLGFPPEKRYILTPKGNNQCRVIAEVNTGRR
jgi:hypothetical protein